MVASAGHVTPSRAREGRAMARAGRIGRRLDRPVSAAGEPAR